MSNGVDFRKMAVDLREQLTAAQSELSGYRAANMVLRDELAAERLRADTAVADANDAERQLAALREELAKAKRTAITEILTLNSTLREELSNTTSVAKSEIEGLSVALQASQQRLIAAEQRNASLSNAMRRAIEWFDDGVGRSHEEFSMIQDMRASLAQPTESGASE